MIRLGYRTFLLITVSILLVATGETCGPEFAGVIFTRENGPDGPVTAFTGGKIGVPLSTWWRAYMVVAYRYLEDKPLSHAESESFARFWGTGKSIGFPSDPAEKALKKWVRARAEYMPGNPSQVLKAYKERQFDEQLNCTASAFATAVDTMNSRAKQFGAKSPEFLEWIHGQDAVFANCDGHSKDPVHPAELPATASPLLRADRIYQTAAAHFYSGDYPDAKADFDAISRDESSPWHSIAPYLAARALLREASDNLNDAVEPDRRAKDALLMKEAEQRLQAIMANPSRKQWHHDAQKLLNLIAYRTEPLQYQHRLAMEITSGKTGEDFGQDVRDYTLLLNKYLDTEPDFPGVEHYGEKYEKAVAEWRRERYTALLGERSDDLTNWLTTFQSDSAAAKKHAMDKWRATRTMPWLFLVLTKLTGHDPATSEALHASAAIKASSPAYFAIAYHRVRLLRESGQLDAARELVNKVLSEKPSSLSAVNLLADEKMKLAKDLENFLAILTRQPVKLSYGRETDDDTSCFETECSPIFYGEKKPGEKGHPLITQFDSATASLLNTKIPSETLVKIVNGKTLPEHLQRRIAIAVWTRTLLLNQPQLFADLTEAAIAASPELKRFSKEFSEAKSAEERRFVAASAVAHFPALRPYIDSTFPREAKFEQIDNFRDNWWCADIGQDQDRVNYEKQFDQRHPGSVPHAAVPFLTAEQASTAESEWETLRSMGSSYNYLPKVIITWAKAHPDDPRAPEALHFSSRVSRYACSSSSEKNNYSHEAFTLLHQRYPKSEWTKKTKFWF